MSVVPKLTVLIMAGTLAFTAWVVISSRVETTAQASQAAPEVLAAQEGAVADSALTGGEGED